MRTNFNDRLERIRSEVIRMGSDANEMVRHGVEATLNGDVALATATIALDDRIDEFERTTLDNTVIVLMQESPVASDLRFLVSTLGVIGELEKVGDDAVKLCRRATKLSGLFPVEMKVALLELGELARLSLSSALRLYAEYDVHLACEIIRADKEIDTAYSRARNRVFELIQANPSATEHLVRTIECFHALEHVADHAVSIANRMRMHYDAEGLRTS